jgi:hypothetical protein
MYASMQNLKRRVSTVKKRIRQKYLAKKQSDDCSLFGKSKQNWKSRVCPH